MRKRRTSQKARGRPNKCITVTVNGEKRKICFDSKGRVRRNVKLSARKRKR